MRGSMSRPPGAPTTRRGVLIERDHAVIESWAAIDARRDIQQLRGRVNARCDKLLQSLVVLIAAVAHRLGGDLTYGLARGATLAPNGRSQRDDHRALNVRKCPELLYVGASSGTASEFLFLFLILIPFLFLVSAG